MEDWKKIAAVCQKKNLLVIFDLAYLGKKKRLFFRLLHLPISRESSSLLIPG